MYDGLKHTCLEGDHIVNVFSFSKAYGMMGWRVGYVRSFMSFLVIDIVKDIDFVELFSLCLYMLDFDPSYR